jgi:CheY-like chemotaxis protein
MAHNPKKVLLVEDDLALNEAFGILLSKSGHSVTKAFNGKEALEHLEKEKPDIILLDLLMPVMDGREFLKNYKDKASVPIVVLSNLDAKDQVEEVLELGAAKFMLKAWATPKKLLEIIDEVAL